MIFDIFEIIIVIFCVCGLLALGLALYEEWRDYDRD